MSNIMRPIPEEYPAFYSGYVESAEGDDLLAALQHASAAMHKTVGDLPPEKQEHRYAPAKWSVKEVVQHVVDCERIFAYRALCIARGEIKDLPGFDENAYAKEARADLRELADILKEHDAVRTATIELFLGMDTQSMSRRGTANGKPVNVAALGWIIAGHAEHHLRIIRERYLA
ncbi:MAG: DinB family protein [Flavobacteriales bacterium]